MQMSDKNIERKKISFKKIKLNKCREQQTKK